MKASRTSGSPVRQPVRRGGTLQYALPVRRVQGRSRLLESLRRLGADQRLLDAAGAAMRKGA